MRPARSLRWFIPLLVLFFVGVLASCTNTDKTSLAVVQHFDPPDVWAPDWWQPYLGGDALLTEDVLHNFEQEAVTHHPDSGVVAATAAQIMEAAVTSHNRDRWVSFFVGVPATHCDDYRTVAAIAAELPYNTERAYWKVLVFWDTNCDLPTRLPLLSPYRSSTLYFEVGDNAVRPVWYKHLPLAQTGMGSHNPVAAPETWELDYPDQCGTPKVLMLVELAALMNILCEDAGAAGISIKLLDGLRTTTEQQARFERATKYYGGVEQALKWVTPATETQCWSKHCAGTAVDIQPDPDVLAWLNETVGCLDNGTFSAQLPCPSETIPVSRLSTYGLTNPVRNSPNHLELAIPLESDLASDCDPNRNKTVPQLIVTIWGCGLRTQGFSENDVVTIVTEALLVANCASGFNPAAVAFNGKYFESPHPQTGQLETGQGLFQLDTGAIDKYLPETLEPLDPAANIETAFRMWLDHETFGVSGWSGFMCGDPKLRPFQDVIEVVAQQEVPEWVAQHLVGL